MEEDVKKKQPKKAPSTLTFVADLRPDFYSRRWPLVIPRAQLRAQAWLSKNIGGVVRCTYELVSKGKQS
jgi:hypothetical protein